MRWGEPGDAGERKRRMDIVMKEPQMIQRAISVVKTAAARRSRLRAGRCWREDNLEEDRIVETQAVSNEDAALFFSDFSAQRKWGSRCGQGKVEAGVSDKRAGDLGARICGLGDNGRAVGGGAACAGGRRRRFSRGGLAGVEGAVRPSLLPLRQLSIRGFLAVRLGGCPVCVVCVFRLSMRLPVCLLVLFCLDPFGSRFEEELRAPFGRRRMRRDSFPIHDRDPHFR